MTEVFETFGIYSRVSACSDLARLRSPPTRLYGGGGISPGKRSAHQECSAADLQPHSAELHLTRTLGELSCCECPHCAHLPQCRHCCVLTRTSADTLSHVICWLGSSWGQDNYNSCPGTHSSLCLRTSLTYKQALTGDHPCEYLFHVGSLNTSHRSPETSLEDSPGSASGHPG